MEPFTIFEVTPLALVLVAWGVIYLRIAGPWLLPERTSMAGMLSDRSKMKFFTEAVIPPDSQPHRPRGAERPALQARRRAAVDVIRGDVSLRRNLEGVELQVGDRVVLRTQMTELLSLQRNKSLKRVDQVSVGRDDDGRGADHARLQDGRPVAGRAAAAAALRCLSSGGASA